MSADIDSKPQASEADDHAASDQGSGSNRRAYPRLTPQEVGALEAARLASGAEIKLIDLSRGGAQFETDRRFLPNSTVSLRLVTQDSTFVVNGRVVRSRIVRLQSGGLGYNVAVAFNELLQNIIGEAPAAQAQAPAAIATPASVPAPTPIPMPPPAPAPPATFISTPVEVVTAAEAMFETMPSALEATPSSETTESAQPNIVNETHDADISREEAEAFDATAEHAPAMLTVTAAVNQSNEELLDMFNGNDW